MKQRMWAFLAVGLVLGASLQWTRAAGAESAGRVFVGPVNTARGLAFDEGLAATLNVNGMLWRTSPAATELEQVVTDERDGKPRDRVDGLAWCRTETLLEPRDDVVAGAVAAEFEHAADAAGECAVAQPVGGQAQRHDAADLVVFEAQT